MEDCGALIGSEPAFGAWGVLAWSWRILCGDGIEQFTYLELEACGSRQQRERSAEIVGRHLVMGLALDDVQVGMSSSERVCGLRQMLREHTLAR